MRYVIPIILIRSLCVCVLQVYKLPFFQDVDLPVQEGARSDKTQFPSDVRNLLAKVSKDRSRGQRSSSRSRRKKPSHTRFVPARIYGVFGLLLAGEGAEFDYCSDMSPALLPQMV